MGHITGCQTVYNATGNDYLIVKGEWPATKLFVDAGANRTFNGESFPWCGDKNEVRDQAFRLFRDATPGGGGSGTFYLFQDQSGVICWAVFNNGDPSYEKRTRTVLADRVNVTLQPDGRVTIAES